ncbi:hypothetical protein JG688_00015369 [Phytophthora aleatoria]|uniref:Uncharacterized protein n=1 Tax=Phytophthora aleatoria TaxID=2496075 RepID=A0A8J5IZK7_9STRA|nr:hypothetical protein JG688_00015369 [Phytophthora aleatoria]
MNIKRQALKAAKIPKRTVRDAINYLNHLSLCRSEWMRPRPPSLDVQRVIDLRKGLHIPESAFYGTNSSRMRGLIYTVC